MYHYFSFNSMCIAFGVHINGITASHQKVINSKTFADYYAELYVRFRIPVILISTLRTFIFAISTKLICTHTENQT